MSNGRGKVLVCHILNTSLAKVWSYLSEILQESSFRFFRWLVVFFVCVCVCVLFCFLIFTPMGTSKLLLYAEGELGSVPNIATSDITTKWNSFATYRYRRPYFSEFDNSFFCRNIARPLAEWISETIEWRGHSSF